MAEELLEVVFPQQKEQTSEGNAILLLLDLYFRGISMGLLKEYNPPSATMLFLPVFRFMQVRVATWGQNRLFKVSRLVYGQYGSQESCRLV